jgi:hypothetical protein
MTRRQLAKKLKELDDAWREAGDKFGVAGERKTDLARWVSENLEEILECLK